MTERSIINQCKKGNAVAQRQIIDCYSKHLYTICVRYTRDREFAKDCLQESWIQILNNLDKYDNHGDKFKAWISRVTVFKTLDLIKKYKKINFSEIHGHEGPSVKNSSEVKMEKEAVWRFLDQLSDQYRVVVNMYLVEGYSHKEIADHLNISESSSRSLLSRAKKMIKDHFKEEDKRAEINTNNRIANQGQFGLQYSFKNIL